MPRAAWGLVGVPGPDVTTAAPQVGLAGPAPSRTGRHTRGGGTLASWWHQSRPACRTRPQAEGLSQSGPSHRSCWEEVAASPRRLFSWCGLHTHISYTKTCRWPGLQKPREGLATGRDGAPAGSRAAGSEVVAGWAAQLKAEAQSGREGCPNGCRVSRSQRCGPGHTRQASSVPWEPVSVGLVRSGPA